MGMLESIIAKVSRQPEYSARIPSDWRQLLGSRTVQRDVADFYLLKQSNICRLSAKWETWNVDTTDCIGTFSRLGEVLDGETDFLFRLADRMLTASFDGKTK